LQNNNVNEQDEHMVKGMAYAQKGHWSAKEVAHFVEPYLNRTHYNTPAY
jgi:hypothetical protein